MTDVATNQGNTDTATGQGGSASTLLTEAPTSATGVASTDSAAGGADAAKTATDAAAKAKSDADAKAADAAKTAASAPEKYEAFKVPDGIQLPAETMTKFEAKARELNLPQGKAQELIDMATAHVSELGKQQETAHLDMVKQWGEQSKADKEFGGAQFDVNMGVAKQAMAKFATPEFRTVLDATGFGNHPEMLRMMVRVGKAISEGEHISGNGVVGSDKPLHEIAYPNMPTQRVTT